MPTDASVTAAPTGSYCDALTVVQKHCQMCHGAERLYGAPMSLLSHDDFQKPSTSDDSKKVYEAIRGRIHNAAKPMPPMNYPRLSDAELATLDAWIGDGAPAGDDECANVATPGDTVAAQDNWPTDCEKTYKLLINNGPDTKYSVPAGKEIHPQIKFDPPWTGDIQALAYRSIVDNTKVLHHWILYAPDGSFLVGWAPGNNGVGTDHPIPPDVGMYLPGTGQMRLDVHYNNLGGTTEQQDASGVEICAITTPSKFRKNTGTVVAIAGNARVPAHTHVDNVSTCTVATKGEEATLFLHSPHMHLLGMHAKLELIQDGEHTMLWDAPFSFDEQREYPLDPPIRVKSGDQFTITCSYTNDTDKDVTFGENTGNEMCFNFVMAYPKGGMSCRSGNSSQPSAFPMFSQ